MVLALYLPRSRRFKWKRDQMRGIIPWSTRLRTSSQKVVLGTVLHLYAGG